MKIPSLTQKPGSAQNATSHQKQLFYRMLIAVALQPRHNEVHSMFTIRLQI